MKKNIDKKKIEYLKKLKEVSDLYLDSSNDIQIELFEASKYIIDELSLLGVGRVWSETYLCYGDKFLMREYGFTMADILHANDPADSVKAEIHFMPTYRPKGKKDKHTA